jgi:hypothetical protein
MAKAKRFMDGGAIPNTYPFANQNAPIPEPEASVQVGSRPEPLANVMPEAGNGPTPTFKKGGTVSSASKRADGCAAKGKTKGRMR